MILIIVVDNNIYYVFFSFMKGSSCSHKLKYKGYLEIIYRCMLDDIYYKLTHMRILYGEITCIYGKNSHDSCVSGPYTWDH